VKRLEDMTEPEIRELMTTMGQQITATAAVMGCEKPLFALILFNDPKVGQYIANCQRADVIKALRECADRLEHRQDVTR
jgi:hypothetical protein